MHIWAGKVLWRVEQVEFRTSSSVSPVSNLVRLAPTTVGYTANVLSAESRMNACESYDVITTSRQNAQKL